MRVLPWVVLVVIGCCSPLLAQQLEHTNPLYFVMVRGGASPLPQVLPVDFANNANSYFSAAASTSSGGNWLTVTSGSLYTPSSSLVSIDNAIAATLGSGTYNGQIVVTANSGPTETVAVTLTVTAPTSSFFADLQGGLTYALASGGAAGSQIIQINSAGSGTLNWMLATSTFNNANFLTVSANSGTAPSLVTVGVAAQNLPGGGTTAGTFVGQLLFTSPTGNVTIPVAVSVGNTSFVQSAPLSFSMPVGGAAPLPQVFPGASNNNGFYFRASGYTGTGGNWLTVSPSNTAIYTPSSLEVGVNEAVASALPAGVYTGEVVVTPNSTGSAPAMTIPVTLTISPSTVPFFDNVPGGMNFFLPPHGANPGSQTLQIRNAGAGTLNWSGIATTADGGHWLTVSALSGAAPSLLTVQIATQNLPGGGAAGIYSGGILFEAAGSTVTVPVTVSVGNTAFLPVDPLSAFMPLNGAAPVVQAVTISSTASGFYFNTAVHTATGGNWLTASTASGTFYAPNAVALGFNQAVVSTLPAGTYTGEIVVSANSTGVAAAMTIPLTLTVAPSSASFFDNFPGGLQFSLPMSGANPGSQSVQVRNAGSGTLAWTVTASTVDGGSWLTVSPNSGTAPSLLSVGVLSQNLPGGAAAGIYNGTLLFQSASGTASLPITVSVGGTGLAQVNPLSFDMPLNGAVPLPQSVAISSTSASGFYFDVSTSTATGGNWLSVSPTGTLYTPDALTVSVNQSVASVLPGGTYSGEVILTPHSTGVAAPMTIPVTLTVSPTSAPFFDSVPGGLQFSLKAHGANPANQTFQLRNAGAGTLTWTVVASTADGGSWLTVSPNNGTAPSLISVGVVAANLPGGGAAGAYNGNLLFQSGSNVVTVPITVSVDVTGFAQVNPLSFTMPLAGNVPLPQEVAITTATSSAFYFDLSTTSASGGNWLKASPNGSTLYPPQSLTVGVNQAVASALPAGTYTAEIIMTPHSSGTAAAALTVSVTLTVAAPTVPFFDNIPGGLYFSTQVSGGNPASQAISIRNEGISQLGWFALPSTSDGGNWLTISSSSGTAPSSLSVGVLAQNLPGQGATAGTYTGQILLQGANGSVTVPVTVDIGGVAFVQSNGLVFTIPPDSNSKTFNSALVGGGSLNLTATSFTGNGGNWLSISPNGTASSPRSFAFTVNSSSLARGTYTGEALFVPLSGGAAGQTVQVTLIVSGPPAASIAVVSGTPQSTVVNAAFANPLIAVVKDASGSVVPGASVTFSAPGSGASGTFAGQATVTVTTDALGNATSPVFTANGTKGSYMVSATVAGIAGPANFSLTNTAPPLTSIAITAPSASLPKGATEQFTATGTYSDGSTANITSQVTWVSSVPANATISATGLATAVAVGNTSISASLNGITSNSFSLTVTNPPLTSIAITAPSASLAKGATEQFTATGTYSDGSTSNITSQVVWVSSVPATATINATGVATAVAVGSTSISASLNGITSNSFALTVTNPPLTSIAITAPSASLPKGSTEQFTATGTYRDGSAANITSQVAWASSVPANATISATGLATAVAVGNTSISASLNGITSNSFSLTVTNPPLTSIAITAPSASLAKGATEQVTATGTYRDGSTSNITSQVVWVSSVPANATISATGLATAVTVGNTSISASLNGITSNSFTLTVTNPPLTSIAITAPSASLAKGTTEQFTATGTYSDGSTANITSQVTWASSVPATATINAAGVATAVAVGSTNISASLSGITSNSFALTVTNPPLTSIAITAPSASLPKGSTEQFTATGTYSDGSTANITSQVAWASSVPATATISATGLATAVAVGSTNTSASLSGITSNSFALTVTNPPLTSIGITAPGSSLAKGASEQFTATGTYSDGSTANITSQVVWASSTSAIATISVTGLATAVAVGGANISASLSGITSNSFLLRVTTLPLTTIAISAPSSSLVKGSTEQFTAIGTYSDGSTANITSQVTWASSVPATATINATGLATAVAVGSTNIGASLIGITSNSFSLTVSQPQTNAPVVVSYSVLFGSQSYNLIGTARNRLPWQITGIRVAFSAPIASGNINSLGGTTATAFSGLGTDTLTWTFNPLTVGSVVTTLSGSGANALLDAAGNPLGNGAGFTQSLKVLWGDFNDDGYVTAADMVGVNNAAVGIYNVFADENGDGVVSVSDVQTVRSRLGTSLP
jgi:hypothetical protein